MNTITSTGVYALVVGASLLAAACGDAPPPRLSDAAGETYLVQRDTNYLRSPFVTAGNRVYMVGHQDGAFPELGWHIEGEMGGIWDHPVKLMDGFLATLQWNDGGTSPLDSAQAFANYPFANKHTFILPEKDLEVLRWQFVPDDREGIVVQFELSNRGSAELNFNFRFTGDVDLRPTWLGERTQMTDYGDHAAFDRDADAWIAKDSLNPWHVVFGSGHQPFSHSTQPSRYSGKGLSAALEYNLSIPEGQSRILTFIIAGSYVSEDQARSTYRDLHENYFAYYQAKASRYEALASRSRLTIPDKTIQQTFEWLKYNCDWLVRTVPEAGTGISAGMPDYPWWFGVDSEYALKGYLAIGQTEPVLETIRLLDSLSKVTNGNGRIIHEVSTNGAVFNEGNINETPQFVSLIWEAYLWTGDKDFLRRYFPAVRQGLAWLMSENDANRNLFPDGFGMMEIHGMNSEMVDVAAYTQRAFDDAAKICTELGEDELRRSYSETALALREKINREFWSEEFNSFADFIGTDEQALKLIEDAIVRADTLRKPWAIEELKKTRASILKNPSPAPRPFVLHHNWVVNTPMEMNIAGREKALKALETATRYTNPFGVFVTGIDRDESAGLDDGSFKGSKIFSYTGAVMTLPTGVVAVAENNYGRPDAALAYLKKMARTFSYALPGSMYEVSPDYGMMTQAWNIYGFAIPIVRQFFGIQPFAAAKRVVIAPQMPIGWDQAALENVIIADNAVSVYYEHADGLLTLTIRQQDPSWQIYVTLPEKNRGVIYSPHKNNTVKPEKKGNDLIFSTTAASLEIVLGYKDDGHKEQQ